MRIINFKHENVLANGTFADQPGHVDITGGIYKSGWNGTDNSLASQRSGENWLSVMCPRTSDGKVRGIIIDFDDRQGWLDFQNTYKWLFNAYCPMEMKCDVLRKVVALKNFFHKRYYAQFNALPLNHNFSLEFEINPRVFGKDFFGMSIEIQIICLTTISDVSHETAFAEVLKIEKELITYLRVAENSNQGNRNQDNRCYYRLYKRLRNGEKKQIAYSTANGLESMRKLTGFSL